MILLLGATGFLGREVLRRLENAQTPTRVLARGSGDWRDSSVVVKEFRQRGIEVTLSDVTTESALDRATEGISCIINMIGVMRGGHEEDHVEEVHVEAVQRMLDLAKQKGIQRVLHVSCMGAFEDSQSLYLRTKWESEQLVQASTCYWTIFRPSFLFGDRFPLLDIVMPVIKFKLFMPILGSGLNQLQPVYVGDVADCIVKSIYDRDSVGKIYDLGGSEVFSMADLMMTVRSELGLNNNTFNVPSETAAKAVNGLSKLIPKNPLDVEVAQLLLADSHTNENALVEKFGITPTTLEEMLPSLLQKK